MPDDTARDYHLELRGSIGGELEPAAKDLVLLGRASLAGLGVDPDDRLSAEADQDLLDAKPSETIRKINYQWGRFIWWTGHTGRRHLNPTTATIRQWIVDHWHMTRVDPDTGRRVKCGNHGQPYSHNTVRQAIYLVATVQQWLGYPSCAKHPSVPAQLDAYEAKWKRAGFTERVAVAITPEESVAIARARLAQANTVAALRDATAYRLQFDSGARASEILGIDLEHLAWESEHRVVVNIPPTKTKLSGRKVAVEATPQIDPDVDPALLLLRLVRVLAEQGITKGPVFLEAVAGRPKSDGSLSGRFRHQRLAYDTYETGFKMSVYRAGVHLDPVSGARRIVTSHSNRAGHVTTAVDEEIPLDRVAARTGHSPQSGVIHRYYRSARRWGTANPGTAIRLTRAQKQADAKERARQRKQRRGGADS